MKHSAGGASQTVENRGGGGARIDRRPDPRIGGDGFGGRIADGGADPALQAVSAIPVGCDQPVLEEKSLGDTHGGAGLAIRVVDINAAERDLVHVDVADRAGARILIFCRARKIVRPRNPEARVVEVRDIVEIETMDHLVDVVFRSGVERATAGDIRPLQPKLLENLGARFRSGRFSKARDAQRPELGHALFIRERDAGLPDLRGAGTTGRLHIDMIKIRRRFQRAIGQVAIRVGGDAIEVPHDLVGEALAGLAVERQLEIEIARQLAFKKHGGVAHPQATSQFASMTASGLRRPMTKSGAGTFVGFGKSDFVNWLKFCAYGKRSLTTM